MISVIEDENVKRLQTAIDTLTKTASTQIKHFSKYIISYPGDWADYYLRHKNDPERKYQMPYYAQEQTEWCVFYATSMLLRYHGYFLKGHQLAALMNKSPNERMNKSELEDYDNKLNQEGIVTQYADPPWTNTVNLAGYLLAMLDEDKPIMVTSYSVSHAFVVTGHNPIGFYVNDPNGVFIEEALGNRPNAKDFEMVLISYDKFTEALENLWQRFGVGAEVTFAVLHPHSQQYSYGPTINIPGSISNLWFLDHTKTNPEGLLELNGTFQPNGYAFVLGNQKVTSFSEDNFIRVKPLISNSYQNNNINVNIHYKIDNLDLQGSPTALSIDIGDAHYIPEEQDFQLGDLTAGLHKLQIELRSENSQIIYDSLSFQFNSLDANPDPPTLSFPTNGAINVSLPPTLSWNASSGATSYSLQVATHNSFSNLVYNLNGLIGTNQQISGLNNSATYYWRVSVTNSYGTSGWSSIWNFTTAELETAPLPPVLSSPPNGAIVGLPTLVWNASNGATSYTLQVEVATDPTFSLADDLFIWSGLTGTSQGMPPHNAYSIYHWRVNAINNYGTSGWSDIWRFTAGAGGTIFNEPCPGIPTVTDSRDGHIYNTVQIGGQCWLKENMDVGTRIDAGYETQTDNGIIEKYCYNNDPNNCSTYGGLYQWDEAMQYATNDSAQGICPTGWHIPTTTELNILGQTVGYINSLKAIGQGSGDGAGTNTSGFSALLTGAAYSGWVFNYIGYTYFWSSTMINATQVYEHHLTDFNSSFSISTNSWQYNDGFCVRCIKN